jgi:hypothetical protein
MLGTVLTQHASYNWQHNSQLLAVSTHTVRLTEYVVGNEIFQGVASQLFSVYF